MNFDETMKTDPTRLVVLFRIMEDGSEQFQWGVVGSMPLLSLIGYIGRVQADLVNGAWSPECGGDPDQALVVAWDEADRSLTHFTHPDVPAYPLAGMLETIKSMLVMSKLGQSAGAQKVQLLGPDGIPMR